MRRIRSMFLAVAVSAGALVAAAGPAQAATPYCTKQIRVDFPALAVHSFVPVSSSGTGECLLGEGSANSGVTALQWMLVRCYQQSIGAVDGIFGPRTRAALVNAQKRMGITADGVYGPVTAHHIVWPLYRASGAFWFC